MSYDDYNYFQEFHYQGPPDTRTPWQRRKDKARWYLLGGYLRWWWTYERADRIRAYKNWWSDRP